ncbi:5-(carboxyamino)imidazole ribonucleotide synthase [Palleronia sp. LCG004]|uniref:5-(carboxyamino)imidazole ribonucleotide synthase n=1 Tax=Palleronia sp. LCG004 TaxID=3079304 RepID=UPI002941CBF7|nr:5-(carboxyamino)imidazole ribonucleotide synthase [Palleronia sp. LCG004]WOI56459.1 5-(carboxyamino)imidazole ribonucleotide synthase [Palleronia sp. LCG004]
MSDRLPTGATIGILGGGQLGRMLSVAAARLGYKCCILDPSDDPPAAHVANFHLKAAYDDVDALTRFARSVDVVTYEFENIPTDALDTIERHCPIRPGREALRVSQDRLTEKTWLADLGLSPAPFADVADRAALDAALAELGTPAILKTRRFGYDGKGQVRIDDVSEADAAWDAISGAPAVLEGFVAFEREISVIAARGLDGSIACYDPGENEHVDGILRKTTVPAAVSHSVATDAVLLAGRILNALEYVGVMGIELFVTKDGLLVNEIAPRVHNSGHWTQDGAPVDQFEQHIRAIAGLPLGDGSRSGDITMENLIGDDVDGIDAILRDPSASLHLYGKGAARPGRKMGHVNRRR